MGSSSRPDDFDCETAQQANQYMVSYLEKWRVAMNITDFYLVGHSWGGYISGLYSLQYSQHIKKLILVSPIGFQFEPDDFNWYKIETRSGFRAGPPPNMFGVGGYEWAWSKRINHFQIYRYFGEFVGRKVWRSHAFNRMVPDRPVEEKEAYSEYEYQVFMRPNSTETCLMIQFNDKLFCQSPLNGADKLANKEFPVPISFVYGDRDWVNSLGSEDVVKANKFFESGEAQLHIVTKSDHNMHTENPKELCDKLIGDLQGTIKHAYETKQQMIYMRINGQDVEIRNQRPQSNMLQSSQLDEPLLNKPY